MWGYLPWGRIVRAPTVEDGQEGGEMGGKGGSGRGEGPKERQREDGVGGKDDEEDVPDHMGRQLGGHDEVPTC